MLLHPERFWGVSHIGHSRSSNQDRCLMRRLNQDENPESLLLAVADGMGGAPGGGLSAQMLIDTLQKAQANTFRNEHGLVQLLLQAGEEIKHKIEADSRLEGMGTTATIACICQGKAYWAHVGDSRLYLGRRGKMEQISTDHRFIQDFLDDGTLSQEEAKQHPMRDMLDQCVGCVNMQPESGRLTLQAGDVILLCSDGLSRHVSDQQIQMILKDTNARRIAENLLCSALLAGGKDNVTILVALPKVCGSNF